VRHASPAETTRLGHGEVRLAGACRSNAEHNVVLFDGVEVAPLIDRFGRNTFAPGLRLRALEEVLAKIDVRLVGHELCGGLHVPIGDAIPLLHQRAELSEERFHLGDLGRRAVHDHIVALRAKADAELRLEVLEVLVVGAEKRFDPDSGSVILATCV
jgi:hypothetical protein